LSYRLLLLLPLALARHCGQKELDAHSIDGCTSFEHLKLLGSGNAVWLGDALHHHNDLELLDLHHTKVYDPDALALAAGLKNNTVLRRLAMHNNRITDVGCKAIAEALMENSALTFLSLSSNGIGDEGAAALGEMLKHNHALRRLDLYFNLINDEGGVAIAEGLKHNHALRVLHLDSNRIGDATAKALAEAIKVNQGLAELTIMFNNVKNDGALAMVEAVSGSTSMHTLEMGHNRHVIGEATEALAALREDHLVGRKELAEWLMEEGLTDMEGKKEQDPKHPTTAAEEFGHHGPALHSPFAAAVKELRPHTPEGLLKLSALLKEDEAALHSHDATAHLTEEQRHTFAKIVHKKVAQMHDEL